MSPFITSSAPRLFQFEQGTRSEFLALLKYLASAPPSGVFHSAGTGQLPSCDRRLETYPIDIFDLPLSGTKDLVFLEGGSAAPRLLHPGDVLYSPPFSWKKPLWGTPHELCCLVFHPDYLRMTYVDFSHPEHWGERPVNRLFYHTPFPPAENMRRILRTLRELDGKDRSAAFWLFRALLELTFHAVEDNNAPIPGKALNTYWKIRHYMEENFTAPITREDTARLFKIHPGYLSRLFKEQGHGSFVTLLRDLRLEHASWLLRHTDFLIDEIANRCGYESSTFFSAAFKAQYHISPARFRRCD